MKLSFSVSQEDYLSALLFLLRRKSRKPWGMFTAFMLTIGQFAAVSSFCIAGLVTGARAVFLLILSGIVFVMNGFLYLPTPLRAKLMMIRMKRGGQWDPEYEKRHTLAWEGDKLVLQYGKVRRKLAAESVTQAAEWRHSLLILTGDVLFCVIPASAWKEGGQRAKEDWIRELRERKFAVSIEAIRKKREELSAGGRTPYRYSYRKKNYLEDLREAHRKAYTMGLAWGLQALLRVGGSLILLYILIRPVEWGVKILALSAAFILLYPYIRTFSFLLNSFLERGLTEILSFAPGTDVDFFVSEQELVFLGEIHYLVIPWEEVLAVKKLRNGIAFYLKNQMILPMPGGGDKLWTLVQQRGRDS